MQDGEIVVEKKVEKDKGTYDSFLKDLDVKDEDKDKDGKPILDKDGKPILKDACRFDT